VNRTFSLCAAFLVTGTMTMSLAADDTSPPLKVMSFNIRYGTARDGENHWDRRKEFVAETIAAFDPDLLGTQETLAFQRDFLAEQLTGYETYGLGRDDGTDTGEMAAVFFRRDRFEKLDAGTFWLSETPDVAGSKGWDTSLPRTVSWLKLKDLKAQGQPTVWFFNTHFDHRGEQARRKSAELLRRRIWDMAGAQRTIVTGDFNAAEGSVPYENLFDEMSGMQAPVIDTFRAAHPQRGDDEGTFSGFRADQTGGNRIDWIACSRDWQVQSAGIDRTSREGRTPSDHFPVTAMLRYRE
jgi:endonuclease/exonuclease/phosphatase family metal-dependent hydrolase